MIQQGRVTVNGHKVTELGTRASSRDRILVDGKPLTPPRDALVLALNKPPGVVTSARDPEGRATVLDLVPRQFGRVYPVGRLDLPSTGLLLLTNDGELAARVMHPRHHVPRVYRVKVRGTPDDAALARLRRGVKLRDGKTAPAEVVVERALPTKSWLRLTVHEGRQHLVRRICEAVGHPVEKLQRVAVGPIRIGALGLGELRVLRPGEVTALRRSVGLR
jgi:23S rRNA pseudouridine2605 synthase